MSRYTQMADYVESVKHTLPGLDLTLKEDHRGFWLVYRYVNLAGSVHSELFGINNWKTVVEPFLSMVSSHESGAKNLLNVNAPRSKASFRWLCHAQAAEIGAEIKGVTTPIDFRD